MYKVLGSVTSRAFRVLWALEEVGTDYVFENAKPRDEAVRALNGTGKIPVMLDGDAVLTDSSAILTYIADKHGALTYPAGSIERAQQDALTFAVLDDVEAQLWTAAKHSFILPPEHRVPEVKPALRYDYERGLAGLAARFKGPFLMGDMMTVPDIVLTHCCNWAISAKFPDPPEALRGYLSIMRARPAFQRVRDLGR